MKRRKNSNLHVVREPEDPTDKIIEEIMDELNSEDGVTEKEIQEELARRKRKKHRWRNGSGTFSPRREGSFWQKNAYKNSSPRRGFARAARRSSG